MDEELKPLPPWSLPVRIAVLVALMLYLLIVVLAPLTNPAGAPHLTTPVAQKVKPIHEALYLNHGYRFFAPDPGPSHSVLYEIETAAGEKIKGHFPDRDNTSPRLLYHRWFMLSESMYREFSLLSKKAEIDQLVRKHEDEIAEMVRQGKTEQSKAMIAERDEALAILDKEKRRFDGLMLPLARNLIARFGDGGSPRSIRMWIQRRVQPLVEESISGMELTDEKLTIQVEAAFFTAEQLAVTDQIEAEPELETISAGGGDE